MNIRKIYSSLFAISAAVLLSGVTSCSDKFDDMEGKSPEWLGSNIYDYLNGRGDCKYFVRLIDDEGLTDVMKLTGSNTLFFANDEAFERYFQTNSQGIRSYEQLPESMKLLFLRFGVVENAQLLERLSLTDNGDYLFRRTTNMEVKDTIPLVAADQLPDNSYFQKLRQQGKAVRLLQDATPWTLVQFFPTVMNAKGITDADLQFITGNSSASVNSPYLYGNQIVNHDIICKNGYLHELKDVLTPPENMAGYIRTIPNLSQFNSLMDRFCLPTYYGRTAEGDSIYELRYFNTGHRSLIVDNDKNSAPATLLFDPAWNLYASTSASGSDAYQQTMGCMFVPTNEAMQTFFSPTGEGADFYNAFGSWDNVPSSMVADIINANMKNNFLQALRTQIDAQQIEDENGYTVDISANDIANAYVARNGLVYVTNKVLAPQDYKTVMGPAKISVANSLFNRAITNSSYSYYSYILRAPKNVFYFFVTPDEYTKGYVDPVTHGYATTSFHSSLDFYLNASNNIVATPISTTTGETIVNASYPLGATGVVSTGIKARMNEILGSQTVVCSYDGEMEERLANGQEYFVTNSYAPLHIQSLAKGGSINGGGNTKPLTILSDAYHKSNGRGCGRTFPYAGCHSYTRGAPRRSVFPAGRLHAIGAGNFLAEIQQTSDVTYRVYDFGRKDAHGNPRELHIEEAKEAIDYQVWPEYRTSYDSTKPTSKLINCPYFNVNRVVVQVATQVDYNADSFVIVICLYGEANINGIKVRQGETLLVPACENILYIFGNATFLTATM